NWGHDWRRRKLPSLSVFSFSGVPGFLLNPTFGTPFLLQNTWRLSSFQGKPPGLNSTDLAPPSAAKPQPHFISGWRSVLLWPLSLIVRLWGRTLKFEESPEDLRNWTKKDVPVAMVLWHNRLFLSAEIVRRYRQGRPVYALVSASQDGAWLSAFFSLVGMQTARGSSSRLGREAASALV